MTLTAGDETVDYLQTDLFFQYMTACCPQLWKEARLARKKGKEVVGFVAIYVLQTNAEAAAVLWQNGLFLLHCKLCKTSLLGHQTVPMVVFGCQIFCVEK